jgi:outer membrane protein
MHKATLLSTSVLMLCPFAVLGQGSGAHLPETPLPQLRNGVVSAGLLMSQAGTPPMGQPSNGTAGPGNSMPGQTGTPGQGTDPGEPLTRTQAEQLALKNNPRVSEAALLAFAQKEVVRENRAGDLPQLNGDVTGVEAEEGSRLSSGALNASRLLNHAGAGVTLNQLITDFGHTRNLIATASFQARAADQNTMATREEIVLAADMAFYDALEAQATLQVAQSTVAARNSVNEQVTALTASKLKSTLDQSFSEVNLSQAQLLQLDAENQQAAAMAGLNEVLGTATDRQYHLIDDSSPPPPVDPSVDTVIQQAMQQRPDLQALRLTHESDVRFARAQRDQLLPTITAIGVAGATPWGPNGDGSVYFQQNWYGAAGVNMSVPIFEGFRYHAEAKEAGYRAQASDQRSRQLTDQIARDVRTAWLTAKTGLQRMTVTQQLLGEANTALELAQARYQLGLSSIVELSQAQLQQTQAQIANANARFQYEADVAALRFQTGTQP